MQQNKVSMTSFFLTLTYDADALHFTKNGFMDLCKADLQLFFKRLRKRHTGSEGGDIKYYAVGEYGGRFRRPHYHVILFNAGIKELIGSKYATAHALGHLKLDGKVPMKCLDWPKGHCTIGQVSEASVGYTMKYIAKTWQPMHRNDDRTPVFSLMSKGLGINYLTKAMVKWHMSDFENRQYCTLKDGKKISMPRYYREKLLNEDQKLELVTLRMFNVLYDIDQALPKENTARERSEAYLSGLERVKQNFLKGQKL